MNIKRILTSVIGLPIIVVLFMFLDTRIIDVLLTVVALRSVYEYKNCAKSKCNVIGWVAYISAILIAFIHIIPSDIWLKFLPISIPFLLLLLFLQVIITDGKTTYKDMVYTFTGIIYIVGLIAFFSLLFGAENGRQYIWFIMFASWGSDILAYIIGKHFGKRKFSKISPNKTIEGCVAGLLGAVILCVIYAIVLNKYFGFDLNLVNIGIISAVLAAIGQVGDFAASVIKRHFEVKDYSNLFPGHGGMIDRIDSIIFIAPFAYYCFIVLLG